MTDQIYTSTSTAVVAPQLTSNGNGRIIWPGESAKKQRFSFPDNIIYYFIQNPSSPKSYHKLAMSCKYFFEKKPLLFVSRIHEGKCCSSKYWKECDMKNRKCCVKIDLTKLASKIWLTRQYYFSDTSSINALFPQKLYKCEKAEFKCLRQTIVFENFKFVASPFKKFNISYTEIFDNDGNVVMLEDILGSLPDVKVFEYTFCVNTPAAATISTMKNIYNLGNLNNIRIFRLWLIPGFFVVKDFEDLFMKFRGTKFRLHFHRDASDEYKVQLDALCDTVIASNDCKCIIEYDGQDEKKFDIMWKRYFK